MRVIAYLGIFFGGSCFGCAAMLAMVMIFTLFQQPPPPTVRFIEVTAPPPTVTNEPVLIYWTVTPIPTDTPTPLPSPWPTETITPLPTQAPNCDPSYPDFCLAPGISDLNCADVPYTNFRVLPPDPHAFDRDQNGIGCENE